jgi:hypothetical protein
MSNNDTLNAGRPRSRNLRRWLALGVAVGIVLPVLGDAQEPKVTVLKSGLHSVPAGHTLHAILVEVGAATSTSAVTIEFRDALDRRRAFVSGTLQRSRPVRLRLTIPTTIARDEVRVIVRAQSVADGVKSERILTLEDLDVDSFQVTTKGGGCAIPFSENPSAGSGPEFNCEDWSVTFATSFEAS